jgi:phosphate transport system ATP-binding protein
MAERWLASPTSSERPTLAVEAPPACPILEARGLRVSADGGPILRGVDFVVPRGSVVCVSGPSGAGKSTLLRCLNRLVELVPGLRVEGEVRLDGQSIYDCDGDALRERIGMLFQQPVVFPGSIRDNVLFAARRLRRASKSEWDARAEAVLGEVGLWEEVGRRLTKPASVLSVGQQQRLCLARVLLLEPELVLMDEPTSALDPESQAVIEALVRARRARQSFVVVTHDLAQARRIADAAVCLSLHEGVGELVPCADAHPSLQDPACRDVVEADRRSRGLTRE